jgi:hypothetical protein
MTGGSSCAKMAGGRHSRRHRGRGRH